MYFGGYGLYILISLPALILGLWAQAKVRGAFARYSKVASGRSITGAKAARMILDANGLYDVSIEPVRGFLSDHYDPRSKVLRLSPDVYQSSSLAAVGVATHEAGHALQDQQRYAPLVWRSAMVPSVQIGSWIGPIIFFVGLFMQTAVGESIAWMGLILFGLTALFAVVTLPVEFDASNRAKKLLVSQGILAPQELQGASAVLDAAALTYVAGAVQAISTLLYYAFLLTGRRE